MTRLYALLNFPSANRNHLNLNLASTFFISQREAGAAREFLSAARLTDDCNLQLSKIKIVHT